MNKKTLVEILDTKRPSNLQDATLQSLRLAFGEFEDNGFKTVYDSNKIIDPVTKAEFATIEDLKNFLFKFDIPKDIPNKYFGILIEHWYENTTPEQNYSEPTLTKTTLDKDESAQLIAEADARNKQKADIKESSDKAVQDALKRKQELIDKKIQEAINNKKVVVIPVGDLKDVELTNGEQETILTFSKIAKEDPATLQQFIEIKIKESLATATDEYKENITPEIITKTATSITDNFVALPNYQTIAEIPTKIPVMHPASPFVALTLLNDAKLKGVLTDEEVRNKVAEMAQVLALGIEAEANVNFAGANAVFGENIASVFYGPADRSITQFEIAKDQDGQKDNGVELSIGDVYDNGKKFYDLYEKIKGARTVQEVTSTSMVYVPSYNQASYAGAATKTASVLTKALPAIGSVYGFKQGVLLSQWARSGQPLLNGPAVKWLTAGGAKETILMSQGWTSKILFTKNFATGYSVQTMQFVSGSKTLYTAGGTFGNKAFGFYAQKVSGKVVGAGSIAVKASGQVITKAVPTAVMSKVGAFLGSFGGWVGTAVGFVVGELFGKLLEKVNWAKVKKFMGEYVLPVAVGGGLVMFGAPVAGLVAGGLLFGVARGATLASMTAGLFGVLGFIGSSIGIAIATPVIITILIIPPLVAFIMLVINNSAYVVPPSFTAESGFGTGGTGAFSCTQEKIPTTITVSSNSPIATRAWEIMEDMYQGFWCYWNRSPGDLPTDTVLYKPSYPELFNERLFASKPNPTRDEVSSCGECLFWCTWLVQKSYKENGVSILYTLWSPAMYDDFNSRGKLLKPQEKTSTGIKPGAVIFFDINNSLSRIDHVGVVHSVTPAGIRFLQSNAGTKDDFIPFGTNGVLQNPSYAIIKGVGNP